MKILLQFPEGLKRIAAEQAENYRKRGYDVFLSASPCYGACDVALEEAKAIGVDKIVHFGHAPFLKSASIPIEYIQWHDDVVLNKIIAAAKKIPEKAIALGTTVQHVHQFAEIKGAFEKAGKIVFTRKGRRCPYKGQILGCDFGALNIKEAEAAVVIASGAFHGVGIHLDKPVYIIHPKTGELKNVSEEIQKARKRRKGAVLKAVGARFFGVMLSTKPGQFNPALATALAKRIRRAGRNAEVIVSNNLDPSTLNNFAFDAFVNTACPRIADDQEAYGKPILNPDMLEEVFRIWKGLKSAP
ncbi:MAG: diphthamide biosynthesis enzyme Dph2 [Candidatus Bilamarchaeaceae archaeon]